MSLVPKLRPHVPGSRQTANQVDAGLSRRRGCRLLVIICLLSLPVPAWGQAIGSRFSPNDFASIGVLTSVTGDTVIDTDALTITGVAGTGVVGLSETGLVEIAIFPFANISLTGNAQLMVVGSRPLALLSQTDIVIQVPIIVSGTPGDTIMGGTGGASGGAGGTDSPGTGLGAGGADSDDAGGGGGFGGRGGDGGADDGDDTPMGGLTYSNERLVELRGGSGGGGASFPPFAGQGGGGGGAIELSALGEISLGRALLGNADDCANAEPIFGGGIFPFDNSTATTDGDPDPMCDQNGEDQIENDIWYCWTATCTDDVTISTCGATAVDTKIAVYLGCTCPTTTILACDDDACGPQSQVTIAAVEGTRYLIRLGTFPGEPGGTGNLLIDCPGGAGFDPGSIQVDGGAGSFDFSGWRAGGGGSGGSILLNAPTVLTGDGFLLARGGLGGDGGGPLSDSGGGGGGGRIAIYADSGLLGGFSVAGGPAGIGGDAPGSPGEDGTLYIEPYFCPPPPPEFQFQPVPSDGEIDTSVDVVLSWEDEGSPCWTEFDVLFDTQDPPQAYLCKNLGGIACDAGSLEPNTTYYWQLITDRSGIDFPGAIWSFTTGSCPPPSAPDGPAPLDGEADVPFDTELRWNFPFDPTGAPVVVAFDGHAVTDDGSEFWNAVSAIGSQVPFFWLATFSSDDPTTLAEMLADPGFPADVFLVPEQETWNEPSMAAWTATIRDVLADFVSTGGVVIVADDGDDGNGVNFMSAAGLMMLGAHTGAGTSIEPCTVIDPSSPIMAGVPLTFEALPGNTSINGPTNATTLAQRDNDGNAIVLSRRIDRGGAVLMGWDFKEFNADMARVIGNAVQWNVVGQTSCLTTYDVFLGTENPPTTPVCIGVSDERCDPGNLDFSTTYYWQVVALTAGNSVPGPIWSFTTAPCRLPRTPGNPTPADQAVDVPAGVVLMWDLLGSSGCDPDEFADGDDISDQCPSVTLSTNGAGPVFAVASPASSTGNNVFGNTNVGGVDIWCENAPLRVDFVDPVESVSIDAIGDDSSDSCYLEAWDGGGVMITRVEAVLGDLEVQTLTIDSPGLPIAYVLAAGFNGDCIELDNLLYPGPGNEIYDVFVGTEDPQVVPLTLVCAGGPERSCNLGTLTFDTQFFWQIVAKNPCGETPGPLWSFTTGSCALPQPVRDPDPADFATGVPVTTDLAWSLFGSGSCDPDEFADGSEMTNACPYVTLSAAGLGPVYALAVNAGPVGNVFAGSATGPAAWCENLPFRAEFAPPVDMVSIRVIGDDPSDFGFLEAYDAANNLIARVDTAQLGPDQEERLTVTSVTADIAYVLAAGFGGECVLLDDLVYPGTEPLTYDVRFGPAQVPGPLPLVCTDVPTPFCDIGPLDPATFYIWIVYAKNACGVVASVFFFETESCTGPRPPRDPVPTDGEIDVAAGTDLVWNSLGSGGCEPDDFADGTDISNLCQGVTLATTTGGAVYAATSSFASTGTLVYSSTPPGGSVAWCDLTRLRADFPSPQDMVRIDVIGQGPLSTGFLEAYDAGNTLITRADTAALAIGQVEGLVVTSATKDIAYVVASGSAGTCVQLDNLSFTGDGNTTYTVFLGTNPAALQRVCQDTLETTCTLSELQFTTDYFWQVVAKNTCSEIPGPLWTFTTLSACAGQPLQDVAFAGLGDLAGGVADSLAFGVAADGLSAVGQGQSTNGPEAAIWTFDGVDWNVEGLGDLPGGAFNSSAFAISSDGSTIAGQGTSASGPEAFVAWSVLGNGNCDPDDYPAGTDISAACPGVTLRTTGGGPVYSVTSLSATTGSRVFGDMPSGGSTSWCDGAPLRADFATPVNTVSIDAIAELAFARGFLEAYNSTGSLIARDETPPLGIGSADTLTIALPTADIAYILTSGFNGTCVHLDHLQYGTMVGLGDLPGGASDSAAFGISPDGSTLVGRGTSASGLEAFVWRNGVMTPLGDLPGGSFNSAAVAISADGLTIVGQGTSASGQEATRWHFDGNNWIPEGLGDLPGGAFGSSAFAVSADGSTIVGQGTSASGIEATQWTFDGSAWVPAGLGALPSGPFFSQALGVSDDGSKVVGQAGTSVGLEAFVWDAVNGMQFICFSESCNQLPNNCWTVNEANAISPNGEFIVGFGTNPNLEREAWIANISSACLAGDLNGDGQLTIDDIALFVAVLLDPSTATQGQLCAADVNQDASIDGEDVRFFVAALLP